MNKYWISKEILFNHHKLQVIKHNDYSTIYVSVPSLCKAFGLDMKYWNDPIRKYSREICFPDTDSEVLCIDIAYVPQWLSSIEAIVHQPKLKDTLENAFAIPSISQKKTNVQTVSQVAKVLYIGRDTLFRLLRQEGILMYNNVPYQEYIDKGYFTVKSRFQPLVNSKGVPFIANVISKYLQERA